MILVNAVYFKGSWLDKFHKYNTEDWDFFLLHGRRVKVPFMNSNNNQAIRAFNGFKVLRLLCECNEADRSFSICIFCLDVPDGLPVNRVCSNPGFLDRHIPDTSVEVGLVLTFSMGAGFTGMADPPEGRLLDVSSILPKPCIEKNKEGIEAAAVTGIGVEGRSLASVREKPMDFVADHLFQLVVREEKSEMALFVGQVVNPKLN